MLAGPFCTMTLGDLGAEVIKVERPTGELNLTMRDDGTHNYELAYKL